MKLRGFFLALAILFVLACFQATRGRAETSPGVALSGTISSAEEGPMEGVLVGAKKAGSTITVTVVSDEHGRYRFPASKLTPGHYALRIRAVGYDLASPSAVEVAASQATADFETSQGCRSLRRSFPTRSGLRACRAPSSKRLPSRIARTATSSASCALARMWMALRKSSSGCPRYPQLSFPMMPQKLVAARVGGGEDPLEQKLDGLAEASAVFDARSI